MAHSSELQLILHLTRPKGYLTWYRLFKWTLGRSMVTSLKLCRVPSFGLQRDTGKFWGRGWVSCGFWSWLGRPWCLMSHFQDRTLTITSRCPALQMPKSLLVTMEFWHPIIGCYLRKPGGSIVTELSQRRKHYASSARKDATSNWAVKRMLFRPSSSRPQWLCSQTPPGSSLSSL